MKRLGIDLGSLSISTVLLEDDRVIFADYRDLEGDVPRALAQALQRVEPLGFDRVGVTGNSPASGLALDNALCVLRGARLLLPGCRNVISVGGQSYMLVFFDERGAYREHTVNPPCAAGTGSFLAQQAERLGLSPRELSDRALAFQGKIPTIATRCAVFAKSDIIHGMQEGFSVDAICAGLCEGMGRSIADALVKGRTLIAPVGIVGGVALNAKVVESIQRAIGVEVVVPSTPWAAAAIGAALLGDQTALDPALAASASRPPRDQRPSLELRLSDYPDFPRPRMIDDVEVTLADEDVIATSGELTLGIDIGSTSTKAALVGEAGQVVCGAYTATRGAPVDAVRRLLRALHEGVPGWSSRLRQAATTGSGRKMIKELFCAELEVNEITAHARAAAFLHPRVDTILEIGGQDSKFTRVRDGQVTYSTMNYVCAAGTGSFIEEQARRLGVTLEELSARALGQAAPYTSDRCTVYMERDLNGLLAEGRSRDEVLAAVLFSVRDNYLAKVVGRHPIGEHVVFQGATARNKALVAAFEQHLGVPIHVSPYCHLTGAIGVALLAQDEKSARRSAFRTGELDFVLEQEPCALCVNRCVLSVVRTEGRSSGWGMKCGREYDERRPKTAADLSRFERRHGVEPVALPDGAVPRGTIGLADALYHKEYNALWRDLLTRLGFQVVVARNGRKSLSRGKALVNSDFCAPIILAHGAMQELRDREVDAIFFPSILNEGGHEPQAPESFRSKTTDSYYCYYSQYAPTLLGNLTTLPLGDLLVAPLLSLRTDSPERIAKLVHEALSRRFPDLGLDEVTGHFLAAWEAMQRRNEARKERRPPLDPDGINVVLAGRPYVAFEQAVSLGIPGLLEERGATLFWQDELDTDAVAMESKGAIHERMHWAYGRKILATAELVARTPGLFLVYLSCFRCSPDSFLMSYVKEIMEAHGKPFLVLQLDEHASDVGYTTRIEAALRTFESHRKGSGATQRAPSRPGHDLASGDTVLIPYVNRLISAFWAESFRTEGFDARMLENSERILHTGYRHANGGECMPAVAIAGGAIDLIRSQKLEPSSTFLYLPTVCMACNFPQFPVMASMAAESAGLKGLKVGRVNFLNPGAVLPGVLGMRLFETSVIASLIYKLYHRIRPYEREDGAADRALGDAEGIVLRALRDREGMRKAFGRVAELFRGIERDDAERRPRVAVLGDMYVKYNEVVNQQVTRRIEDLGGEIVLPSITEMTCHFLDVDVRAGVERAQAVKVLQGFEARYEKQVADLIGEDSEPDWDTCAALLEQHGFAPSMAGETTISVGRALYWLSRRMVDAIVHVNPMFCCPGVVSASLFRRLQAQYGVPIIDLFYDGTGDPNRVLIPHLASLVGQRAPRSARGA